MKYGWAALTLLLAAGPAAAQESYTQIVRTEDVSGLRTGRPVVTTREWSTVRIPASRFPLQVLREPYRPPHPSLASPGVGAPSDTGADWSAPWPQGFEAESASVVVGMVDTGVLLDHPAFQDKEGNSRIAYYWDQEADQGGRVPADLGYGRECSPRTAPEECGPLGKRDLNGHGTHVLSIAAGSGPDTAYHGVDPNAIIVAVGMGLSASGGDIANGVHYIFERARELGLPAVVNVSYGSQMGLHTGDGSSSALLDAMVGPGRIVVTSAGNDAVSPNLYMTVDEVPPSPHHTEAYPDEDGRYSIGFDVVAYEPITLEPDDPLNSISGQDYFVLELWGPKEEEKDSVPLPSITLVPPSGAGRSFAPGTTSDTLNDYVANIVIDHGTDYGGVPDRWHAYVYIEGPAEDVQLPAGEWAVHVDAPRVENRADPAEIWLAIDHFGHLLAEGFQLHDGVNRHLIGSPGDGHRIITVASWTNAPNVKSAADVPLRCTRCTPENEITYFSAPGPLLDGRAKPDIAAAGDFIAGARSPNSIYFRETDPQWRERVAPNPDYGFMRGTSQAAPQVAGAIGRLLRIRPTLTPEEARAALQRSATQDLATRTSYSAGDDATGVPNLSWGAGRLNIEALLDAARAGWAAPPLEIRPRYNPVRERYAEFMLRGGDPNDPIRTLAIYSVHGRRVRELTPPGNRSEAIRWDLTDEAGRTVANGVYVIFARTESGERVHLRLVVAQR